MKYKFNYGKQLSIYSSSMLAAALLISGCSHSIKNSTNQTSNESNETDYNVSDISGDNSNLTTIESSTLKVPKGVDYIWDYHATERFSKYVEKNIGISLAAYVRNYGFTEELNGVYTRYINEYYSTDYDMVPFKSSNYFYSYLVSDGDMHRYRKYEIFKARFLNKDLCLNGTFNNKFIMSYLIQNNIPFGTMIDVKYFKNFDENYININKKFTLEYYDDNTKLGNYDKSYKYSSDEALSMLKLYNNGLGYIFYTEGLKEQNILADPELCEIINGNLREFYGDKAPKIGEVMTKEQYMAIFGEEPLDLSYIKGAVMQVPQETMASPVSYIDYNNYNVYYNPNYNMYSEEDTGRSR